MPVCAKERKNIEVIIMTNLADATPRPKTNTLTDRLKKVWCMIKQTSNNLDEFSDRSIFHLILVVMAAGAVLYPVTLLIIWMSL